MRKTLFTSITAGTMVLFLVTACAEDSRDTEAAAQAEVSTAPQSVTEEAGNTGDQDNSLMDQPVNFSTAEDVEKTLQNIREQEGDAAYNSLKNAMQYLLFYDLSVGNDKTKLYKKLDGRTPQQIIAKMKR